MALPPSAHDPSTAVTVCPTAAVPVTEVPPELVGAVGADSKVKERVTVAAVANSPVDALFAEIVQSPVCPLTNDTVAWETPFDSVDAPTVQRASVDEVKFTRALDDVVAETVNVRLPALFTRSDKGANEILFASPTKTRGSIYILAPSAYPPDRS
ncbi:unannotated protein [freshwater metagenome]|uniref:Unannotated protein n=1 Tax=freshwater metagenome TaxID=449393 RepID=A0A6J6DND9_9ZZZZ